MSREPGTKCNHLCRYKAGAWAQLSWVVSADVDADAVVVVGVLMVVDVVH